MANHSEESYQQRYRILFWLLLGGVTLFRLIIADRVGLGVDESHYVLYSRRLAWGYFDHPPMVGFLAALTTIAGDALFFIRLGPILCSSASLILLRSLALALYRDERIAFGSALLLLLMPYQHLLMVGLLPDATLNLFWCATLLAVWYGMKDGNWFAWILAGVSFGGALLSKYHAVLLPVCLFCYVVTSAHRRVWLIRIQPYVAGLIGLTLFLPNIFWNARNNWISYAYQLGHGTGSDFSIGDVLKVFGGQLGAWSPLIFGLLIAVYIVMVRNQEKNESDRFIFWTSLPVFIFFIGIGIFGRMLPHWTSIGWWTGSLAVTVVTIRKFSRNDKAGRRWRRWSTAAAIVGLLMTGIVQVGIFQPVVAYVYPHARSLSLKLHQHVPGIKPLEPFKSKHDITNELFGWEEIATKVENLRARMPRPEKTFVFTHRSYSMSQLGVYLNPETVGTALHYKFNQFRLWFPVERLANWDALFVDDDRFSKDPKQYLPLFHALDPAAVEFKVYRNENYPARDIKVYRFYGFKGKYEE